MNDNTTNKIIEAIASSLEIPPSAYEKAEVRYNNLGAWFDDSKSASSKFSPHIYPQGSFRLGTVIRPLNENDSYDLDLGCRLRSGIGKATHSQEYLKKLVGRDLERYRTARGIEETLEEKHRCWRLEYADELSFHLDVVPSIPQEGNQVVLLKESMVKHGTDNLLADTVAKHSGAIDLTPEVGQIINVVLPLFVCFRCSQLERRA